MQSAGEPDYHVRDLQGRRTLQRHLPNLKMVLSTFRHISVDCHWYGSTAACSGCLENLTRYRNGFITSGTLSSAVYTCSVWTNHPSKTKKSKYCPLLVHVSILTFPLPRLHHHNPVRPTLHRLSPVKSLTYLILWASLTREIRRPTGIIYNP